MGSITSTFFVLFPRLYYWACQCGNSSPVSFFPYQDNVIVEDESHFECGDASDSSGDDSDRELLNRLGDCKWKTISHITRSARIQEKMKSFLDEALWLSGLIGQPNIPKDL
ncbi:unnamed protein product [Cuscuta europaea]|uniref:Uncharacterized protein n=1 Tax=Cuscuta europaea TaxID=41803 RepID=A0A9P1ED72_CUSEU|nr:unnamed protein product [Cuscuta europaea]